MLQQQHKLITATMIKILTRVAAKTMENTYHCTAMATSNSEYILTDVL